MFFPFLIVNIALQKPAYQQYPYIIDNDTFDASNAVDGRKSNMAQDGGQCAISADKKETATWWVNLRRIHSIHHITIYFMTNNMRWGAFILTIVHYHKMFEYYTIHLIYIVLFYERYIF